jgi:hypothetical protein
MSEAEQTSEGGEEVCRAETQRIRATDLDPELRVPEDAYDRFRYLLQAAVKRNRS